MSVLISVPIGMAISQYSNLNHACDHVRFSDKCNNILKHEGGNESVTPMLEITVITRNAERCLHCFKN